MMFQVIPVIKIGPYNSYATTTTFRLGIFVTEKYAFLLWTLIISFLNDTQAPNVFLCHSYYKKAKPVRIKEQKFAK